MNNTNNNSKKLYDALTQDYDLGSYEQFVKDINVEEKRKKLYDAINKEYDLGEYSEFSAQLGFSNDKPEESNTGERKDVPKAVKSDSIREDLLMNYNIMNLGQRTENLTQSFNQHLDNLKEYGLAGMGHTVKGKPVFDVKTGGIKQTYITPYGNKYTQKEEADYESFIYRQEADSLTISGQLRNARQRLSDIEERMKERGAVLSDEHNKKKPGGFMSFVQNLNSAAAASKTGGMYMDNPEDYTEFQQDSEYQSLRLAARKLREQIQQLENAQEKDIYGERFWHDFMRNTGQSVFNIDAWDFGKNVFRDAQTIQNLANKDWDKLSEAERSAMLELYMYDNVMKQYGDLGRGARWGDIAGWSLSFMKDFLITGGFSGLASKLPAKLASSLASRIASKAGIEATKSIGVRVAKEGLFKIVRRGGKGIASKLISEQGVGGTIGLLTTKAVGVGATDLLIRSPLMAVSVQGQNAVADVINTKLGPVFIDKDTGNLVFQNDKSLGESIYQTISDRVIENFSEMWGGHIPGIADVAKVFGARNLTAMLLRSTREGANTILSKTANFLSRAGVNGYFGEVGEEYYGQLWRSMLELDSAYGYDENGNRVNNFKLPQFHGDIWGGMALSIGLTGGGAIGVNYGLKAATYLKHKHEVDKADIRCAELLTDDWAELKPIIDATENTDIGEIVSNVMSDNTITEEIRSAVMKYIEKLLILRGYNLREVVDKRNGYTISPEEEAANQNFIDGYNATSQQEISNIKKEYKRKRQQILNLLAEGYFAELESNPIETLEEIINDSEWTDEEKKSIIDYVNIKQLYNGINQRINDDVDSQILQSDANIESRVNRNSGTILEATIRGENRKVYIVSGNIVLSDIESGIDISKSDENIIVRDAETGKMEMVSPDIILSIDNIYNPEEEKKSAEQKIRIQSILKTGKPLYEINKTISFIDDEGNILQGIIDEISDDGILVSIETPVNGIIAPMFISQDELDSRIVEYDGILIHNEDVSTNITRENVTENPAQQTAIQEENTAGTVTQNEDIERNSALARIPKDAQGQPIYEQTDRDTAWDAIVEQTGGDETMAQNVAAAMLADKKAELKKLEKAKSKGGKSVAEKIASERERKLAIEEAIHNVDIWRQIAETPQRRKAAVESERRRKADEAAALKRLEEEKSKVEREEAERKEREALNGVPDIIDDTPKDARARGFRRVNGYKIDRQEPLAVVMGKDVQVKFADNNIQNGRVAVIDASNLQPSHLNGVRNPAHFIDEAQPKERNDDVSIMSVDKIARNIRPEEITSSVTAYTGAPTVNVRGEVIQGNNRSSALRQMWDMYPKQAERYKQYIKDHAEEFGLNVNEIDTVKRPVLVNMLDVEDADAITLGQYVAQDTESGGTERIKPRNAVQRIGNDMRTFANMLLKSADDESSFAELVDTNGHEVLKWMNQRGFITPTQYRSAFDSKSNLTSEAKNDLKGIMYQSIFKDGNIYLEEMFNNLPAKAQRAILATAYLDYDSPSTESMIVEIQNSIRAYYALSQYESFVSAKNFKDARIAVEEWKRQYQIDDVTGGSYLPADNFSNFALHLATMYKGESQSLIQGTFNKLYDLIQGTQEENLFEHPDNTPRTLVQAIKETLNIDYNGQQRSNVLAGDSATSQRRKQGGNGTPATRERVEDGNGKSDDTGRIESNSGQSNSGNVSLDIIPKVGTENDAENTVGYTVERRFHKKNGTYIHAVKFSEQMPRERFLELKKRVKDFGGYYSSFGKGGFIFDNETDAHKFAEAVLDQSGELLEDSTPVTLSETRKFINQTIESQEQKTEISGQETPQLEQEETNTDNNHSGNRLVTDERYEELKKRMRAKLGQLNVGIDPEILAIGTEMAVYHIEKGARKFAEYAKAMIADIGDIVRPYLKSFYNGARDLPEVIDSGMANDMTPYDDVRTFDIANFDKEHTDPFATVENTVAEQEIGRQAAEAKQEIISKRNTERRKEDEQTTADTEIIANQAEAIANQAESDIETATDEQQVNEIVENVDNQLDKVNKQLALLGYYEAEFDDKDFNEAYGYMRNAEKKAVKDANSLAKRLVKDLGITPELLVDNKGKRIKSFARANIAPAGGEVIITIPLMYGRELNVYIYLRPTGAERGGDYIHLRRGDNLYIEHIMYRIENPSAPSIERYGNNQWIRIEDADYKHILRLFKYVARSFLPKVENVESDVEQAKGNDPKSYNGYKIGDKVIYTPSQRSGKPTEAVIYDFEDHEGHKPVLDTGLAPILYEVADWSDIKPINQNRTIEKPSKTHKKSVSSQKKMADLFGGLSDDENLTEKGENGLQRNDAVRPERLSTDSGRHEERLSEGSESGSEIQTEGSQGIDPGRERGSDAVDRTVQPRSSSSIDEYSIDSKHQKAVESNKKLAEDLKGVTLHVYDTLGGEREITGITYYELANVFHCNDNISGPFDATRKELDSILEVARKTKEKSKVLKPKNTRNNHTERGVNHAPTSVDARIEANIKAIELANQLIENGETATPEQMAILRKFSGWGGLGKAFNDANISQRLQEILGAEGLKQAVMSANSAYYTPAYVVDTLWDIAEQMGFEGGNILEGSAGIGNILGQMPTQISERSDIHAIEIDRTSGGILSLLYPDAKVEIQGFEQTHVSNGSVDLAITNVPFVTGLRVDDTTGDKDLSKKFHNIHDFCIAKNVRKLREGGIGIFISSNGTLDNSKKLRDWIVSEGGSDFVGAFRMNNKTFGGTSVTSDIIVIRKRVNGRKSPYAIDVSAISGERTAKYDTGDTRKVKGVEIPVIKQLAMDYNRYFIEHPENMAGTMRFAFEEGETFRPTSKGLYPTKGKDQKNMLADFVKGFSGKEWQEEASDNAINESDNFVADASADGRKVGEMYVKDGNLVIASLGGFYPLDVNANKVKGHTKVECFNAYSAIKEALADVLEYQTNNDSNSGLKPLLDRLNKTYDDFVSTYGHFNKNTAIAFLRNDIDYPNVFSLERYEEIGDKSGNRVQKFGKTDVFVKRVVEREKELIPTNVRDGIIASVFKFGRIDIPYIASQLGENPEDVKRDIIENKYGFEDPITRQIEVSYLYLSGNVREKLRQAQENNENGMYDGNIKALQDVMPLDIPAHLIDFSLGSSWIDPKLYEEYVMDRTEIPVSFTSAGGTWFMAVPDYNLNKEKNRSLGIVSEMLHKTIFGHTLIEAAIQNRTITVSQTNRKWDGTTETITDKEATQACAAKIDEIRQDFKEWARQKMQNDSDMSVRMERIYNDTFNNYVPISIPDEFVPEYFGGASRQFKMRPHQGRAIVRGTMQPLMLAHEVGTGKTFTLISTAMEMRRLGTARKPMIVVQNATVGQFVASAKELYPNAKILTIEESDRSAEGRKNFYAKIRYNDWDMIVVPQSTFEFIPDSEERQMAYIQDKIEEKKLVLEQMSNADPSGQSIITRQAQREIDQLEEQLAGIADEASKKRNAAEQKKLAVSLQNAEVRAKEMLDRRTDDVENFDDMGIDALLIDEAHEYKHLGFATAMQRGVKGVDPSYSKKSQGVYLKTQTVLENNNGRNVIFATGTPISNTAAEIWTFMRYLMPADTMREYGIYYFDDFVRNFGNIQQMLEFTTSGRFKETNRFAGYINLPELVRIWSGVSDTVLTREAGGVSDKIPEMEAGKAQDIYLPQTRALRGIMKFVKAQLDRYEKMSGKEKKENSHIPLTMYGIAKAAAVDARLVQADAEDDTNSKTNEAVRQTLRSLKETESYKGTVAIFADNYQNKQSGFNLYDDIRDKLIAEGIPAEQIVIMRSGMTIKKKLEIFDKVNRGEIRVILGSTFTLGTGVNIQERLHTLIHLDAPNRPMDYTQRNGRILRQGNLHKSMGKPVRILRFGVEDSLDVTAYQRLKTKGAIADSIMDGKRMMANSMSNRVLEEEEDVFGDTVAQLSGSEYALLKNNAEKNVRKYESRKKQWEVDQTHIHNAKPKLKALIERLDRTAKEQKAYLEAIIKAFPNGTFSEITVGKHTFQSVESMDDYIKEHNKAIIDEVKKIKESGSTAGQTRNLTISLGGYAFKVQTVLSSETTSRGGQLFTEVHRKMTYSCPELGLTDVPVHQSLLRNAIDDIINNVITGKDFAERIETAERSAVHNRAELKQLESREGKPFEYQKELEQAREQLEEYTEAMRKEMAEKEAKYAEMDASVKTAENISIDEDDDVMYRLDDTRDEVEALFYDAVEGNLRGKSVSIGVLTDEGRKFLENLSGISLKERVNLVLNPSDLVHIYKDHFGKNEKDNGQNIPLDIKDVRSIVDVISNPDNVVFFKEREGLNRNMFYFFQETDNGTYNLMEIYSDRRGNLSVKTFYKTRKDATQRIMDLKKSLFPTSETNFGAILSDTKIPQMFESTSGEEENTERSGDNVITPTRAERKEMVNRVKELAEKLHLDNVEVVTSVDGLDEKTSTAKGFYTKSTGKISIVIPNNKNVADAEITLFHEAVAHFGLRKLFGAKDFNDFLDSVFKNADVEVRKNIIKLSEKNGWNIRTATEEYLATIAENMEFENAKKSGLWQKIKRLFAKMFEKLGLKKTVITDDDLRYILYRSYFNLAEDSIFDALRGGEYVSDNNKKEDNNLYRKPTIRGATDDIVERYERRIRGGIYQTQEALQDSMLGLKEFMRAVLGKNFKHIEDVAGYKNPYLGENRLSSVNEAEAEAMGRILFDPLYKEVSRLAKNKDEREQLFDYMFAKHGLERNAFMSRRDAQKAYEENKKKYPSSKKTLAYFIDKYSERDYAGLTSLTRTASVDEATLFAQDIVDEYEKDNKTGNLWKQVNAVNKSILSKLYDCGIIGKDTYENIKTMYKYYIPLRGFDDKTTADVYAYLNYSSDSNYSSPIKGAKGRRSKADNPLVYMESMAESAIVQGNRNKLVKQRFLNFVLSHPSKLASVSELWLRKDEISGEWTPALPNIDVSDSAEVVERKMQKFEEKMQELAKTNPESIKKGSDAINIPYRIIEKNELNQHQVFVKRGGKTYVITINGNPRAAQAVNGLTNPDNRLQGAVREILNTSKDVLRAMSSIYTLLDIDFLSGNLARDTIYANTMVWIKENPEYAIKYHKNHAVANPVTMLRLFEKYRRNILDMNNPLEKMFYQFIVNGGETGYTDMADIAALKKKVEKAVRKHNRNLDKIAAIAGEFGRAVENSARFAAFITSREIGRSIDRAVWDAKDISVNFNKKGAGDIFFLKEGQTKLGNAVAFATALGSTFKMFFNAGVQGTIGNFIRHTTRHPLKGSLMITFFVALGYINALLSGGDDDDEERERGAYFNLSKYVRRQNIMIKLNGNTWGKIPLPIEYKAFYGLGEMMGSAISNNEEVTPHDLISQMCQLAPVDMMTGQKEDEAYNIWLPLLPDIARPIYEAENNVSFTGLPLYRDNTYNKDMPEWTRAYPFTNRYLVELSAALNEARMPWQDEYDTGDGVWKGQGSININPAKVEHYMRSYLPFFKLINQLLGLVDVAIDEKTFDMRYIPVVNRFLQTADERSENKSINSKYFEIKKKYEALKTRYNRYLREDLAGNTDYDYHDKASHISVSDEYKAMMIYDAYSREINKYEQIKKELHREEEIEQIDDILIDMKAELINAIEDFDM